MLIAVVGPPKSGKSTLVKSLVKHFTKQTISNIKGPITVVASKKLRLTFVECPNDINAMLDCAKTADLVLLLTDASFGFELETFEFLNMLKIHGFPKVIGVLTHLDKFENIAKVNKIKRTLKKRFWTEIVDGARLFYFSGLMRNRYPQREVLNLARFISVSKVAPLKWKNTHPYVLVDRFEDVTDPVLIQQDPKCRYVWCSRGLCGVYVCAYSINYLHSHFSSPRTLTPHTHTQSQPGHVRVPPRHVPEAQAARALPGSRGLSSVQAVGD
jgi:ribosome biogenesis protein BMS1